MRKRASDSASFFAMPRGDINGPADGDEVGADYLQVFGWALFPGARVARVEVAVGGGRAERARLAMPRRDVHQLSDHPSAPISGFEYVADLRGASGQVEIAVVAWSSDGRRIDLDPVTVSVGPVPEPEPDRAAPLRRRAARFARSRGARSDGTVRILAFSHQLPYGGASLYMLEVLRRFVQRPEFECTVIAFQDGPLRRDLESLGIEVHVADGWPFASPARYESSVAELMAWTALQRFDVAFVNTLGSFQGADVAGRLGLPVVWGVHESFELPRFWFTAYPPGSLHPYVRRRAETVFRDAAAIVFEAEATRRLFLGAADPDRLITLPYGIELDSIRAASISYDRAEVRAALGLPAGARVILCLGTIEPRKSQAMLAEAFSAVADRRPDAILALVGEIDAAWCTEYVWGLRAFAERSGLGDRLRIVPVAANAYPWHVAADVHVCASDLESLPRSVLEAMAFGVPVLSTRVFGITEVIEDGVSGYLCDVRDAGGLAAALDRVLAADAGELRRVAEEAAAVVYARHEPRGYADRLWELFEALAHDRDTDVREVLLAGAPARELAT